MGGIVQLLYNVLHRAPSNGIKTGSAREAILVIFKEIAEQIVLAKHGQADVA